MARRGSTFETTDSPPEPQVPVVFVRPLPQIVPLPTPPPAPASPAPRAEVPRPAPATAGSGETGEAARPRRPDLVFVIDPPEEADPAEPRVAGTAGVTLPEVAPESQEEALQLQETPRRGWVVLRVLVRQDGTVQEVAAEVAGDAEAAARMAPAVQRLLFRPALLRGRPVDAWFTMVWPPR
jgi:hypothetical protein